MDAIKTDISHAYKTQKMRIILKETRFFLAIMIILFTMYIVFKMHQKTILKGKIMVLQNTTTSLFEKYRPRNLRGIVGQTAAVDKVSTILEKGWGGRAFWISGASGIGKTSLARIIAEEGATDWFVEEYDSGGDFDAAAVEDISKGMYYTAAGKGGRAYIINEAHGLRQWIIQRLLGLLERIPRHVVFIFTTTKAGEKGLFDGQIDAGPLLSRCICIELDDSQEFTKRIASHCRKIAKKEQLDGRAPAEYVELANRYKNNCRAMLQAIETGEML